MAFKGKVALITGGGSGMGQTAARKLAEQGAQVAIFDVSEEGMAKTVDGKLRIAKRLYDFAVNKYGLPPEDLLFDPVTFTMDPEALQAFLDQVPFFARGRRRYSDTVSASPEIDVAARGEISTQAAFGRILDQLAKGDSDLADRIVTMSPDVTGTTSAPSNFIR